MAEIAVVHVEPDGTIGERWETLVNPQRDLGPQRIHGIRAADILEAPVFGDIAHDVVELLAGAYSLPTTFILITASSRMNSPGQDCSCRST